MAVGQRIRMEERHFVRALARAMPGYDEHMRRRVDAYMMTGHPSNDRLNPSTRAEKLFADSLTPTQRATWYQERYLHFYCSEGALHVLLPLNSHNVIRVTPRVLQAFCAVPTTPVPEYDAYYFQKLWVETDVAHFRTVAFPGRISPHYHYSVKRWLASLTGVAIPDVPDHVSTRVT